MSDVTNGASARGGGDWRSGEHLRWAVLDTAGEPKGSVYPTVYVADELLVDPRVVDGDSIETLRELARRAGWSVDEDALEDPILGRDGQSTRRSPGTARSIRVLLRVADSQESGVVAETPDAWQLLRQARRDGAGDGISLSHVISTDSLGLNPFKANPFKANPFKANPFKANPFKANAAAVGIDSYASPGFGGRQPVTYVGAAPARRDSVKRRPVVAVLDTGCGEHPWFEDDVLIAPYMPNGEPIGIVRPATDPEYHPSLGEPLDGVINDAAGHGTFIAGILLQQCPDARVLPVRVADGEGVILENELIGTLGRLLELMQTPAEKGGVKIDVLNLSFSYYHETPDVPEAAAEFAFLLEEIRKLDCVVVCSAGNEATDRPTFPAALSGGKGAPHVSVGALNPSDHAVALFSNVGDWVTTYAPGVSLLSTQPVSFDGSVQAGMRDDCHGHCRETLDIDDFRGGFAVWSGTSFAAPVVAGRIAEAIAVGHSPATATKGVLDTLREADHSRLP